MNAALLLEHYARIADAPDAIARLRRFVLELAVRGKLVEQDAGDEPASELLKHNRAKVLKGRKASFQNLMAEIPHSVPPTWEWVPVSVAFEYDAGRKVDAKALRSDAWLLELEDIEKDTGRLVARVLVSDRSSLSTKSEFAEGDILYGKLRPYLNKVIVAGEAGYSTTEIVALRPRVAAFSPYCALALRRPDFVEYVSRLGQGTKMPRLRTEDALVAPFPLPPLAEQHRIVAKVDELMDLCDQLETARAEREAARDTFTLSTLAKLNTPDPETFGQDARFAPANLAPLTTRPDQIKQLRQTILNLAVRGRLVAQDTADEPASELLSKLAKFRAIERRRSDALAPVEDQTNLSLRKGWIAARFGEVFSIRTGYAFKSSTYAERGTLILRVVNFDRQGRFDLSDAKYIDGKHIDDKISKFHLVENDILMVMVGGTIGKTAKVGKHILPALLNQNMWRIRSYGDLMSVDFSFMLVRFLNQNIDNLTNSTHGHFAMGDYEQKVVPIPPLAEQHRIVSKVDELMALCDELEASITKGEQVRSRLLEVVLHNALGPA